MYTRSEFERVTRIGAVFVPLSGFSGRSRRSEMEITRFAKNPLRTLYARTGLLCIHDSTPIDIAITAR